MSESPYRVGDYVRVVATGAVGVVVEVFVRHGSADVDLGDGIIAEMEWGELAPVKPTPPPS